MAAVLVNKIYHACCPNVVNYVKIKHFKNNEILLLYSAGIRKRSVTNHVICRVNGIQNIQKRYGVPLLNKLSTHSMPSPSIEKDLKIVRNHLQDLLAEDRSVVPMQKKNYINIVDKLMKFRLNELSYEDLNFTENHVTPAELYLLGSKIFSLQYKVGEEAAVIATPLFKHAASLGHRDARYTYGQLLIRGKSGVQPDPVEAANLFTELAKEGHPNAQFTLAGMYYTGYGIEQCFEKCHTLYQIAGENGIIQSYNSIGKLYLNGQGVEKSETKAVEYFMKGAESGDPHGYMSLGHCYSHGKGVEVDFKKSFESHLTAAEMGYPSAIYNVGTHYFLGKGVGADPLKAAEYFKRASDLGFTLAYINLGNMYYQGHGVEKNWEKAKELYRRAASKNKDAQILLDSIEEEEKELQGKNRSDKHKEE